MHLGFPRDYLLPAAFVPDLEPDVIAIISDLHSNIEALTAAMAEAKRRGAKRIVCLGDVIGYGASPRETLQIVRQKCEWCIFGNHEEALLNGGEDFNDKARAAIDWTRQQLSSRDFPREENYAIWDFLDALQNEKERREENALFVHGSPFDPVREYVMPRDARNPEKMARIFAKQDRPICFVGHSHVPGVYTQDGRFLKPAEVSDSFHATEYGAKVLVNVGSVGQPRDGDIRLSFVMYDGKDRVDFVRIPYDAEKAAARIRAVPALPEYLANRLLVGR
ncbi:MAG: metallophosphoesterase family protein [Planctomycetes bacterium]|nr:metallophosphoesterase family protein [Planctomycetota bacterium]